MSLYKNTLVLCMWRNSLHSVELVYVFHSVSSMLPKICTMNEESCSTLGLGFVSNAKTMQQTSYTRKCGVNGVPLLTLTLPASKSMVGLEFDGQLCLVAVRPGMTSLQQGCPLNNSPTADFNKQRLHCITAFSSPRKCVRTCTCRLLWNTLASGAKHVRLYG